MPFTRESTARSAKAGDITLSYHEAGAPTDLTAAAFFDVRVARFAGFSGAASVSGAAGASSAAGLAVAFLVVFLAAAFFVAFAAGGAASVSGAGAAGAASTPAGGPAGRLAARRRTRLAVPVP